jgi:hypothetical protein
MKWFLKKFWVVIVTFASLVGIYYLPVDTIGLDEASGPWRRVIAMIDQNTALWIFGMICLAYISWIEVRPFVKSKLRKSHIRAVKIDAVAVRVRYDGEDFWENQFYLVIVNSQKDARTLSEVKAKIFSHFSEHATDFANGSPQINLHGGETARIFLGASVTESIFARPDIDLPARLPKDWLKMHVTNTREQGHRHLSVGAVGFMPILAGEIHQNPDNQFVVQVLANGVQPHSFHCRIGVGGGEPDIFLTDLKPLDYQPHTRLDIVA